MVELCESFGRYGTYAVEGSDVDIGAGRIEAFLHRQELSVHTDDMAILFDTDSVLHGVDRVGEPNEVPGRTDERNPRR
jgi:hypothetical protein